MKENIPLNETEIEKLSESEIDELLSRPFHAQIRSSLQKLPEDTPSMTWRSQLNERLVAEASAKQSRKRRSIWTFLSPIAGLALAGSLAFVLLTRPHPSGNGSSLAISSPKSKVLAQSLVAEHSRSEIEQDVVGAGLSPKASQGSALDSTDPDSGINDL